MANVSPFRIDILDAAGNRLGDGPLTTVLSLSDTRSLDKIGELQFALPASDPRTALVRAGRRFDVWDEQDGYLGRFFYRTRNLAEQDGIGALQVSAWDALRDLGRDTVGFRRVYNFEPVEDVINDLVGLVPGWTANVEDNIGHTTVTYEGESPFRAVDEMRDRWHRHFRLQSYDPGLYVLDFGSFGERLPVRLTNLQGQVQSDYARSIEVAYIDRLSFVDESDLIYNCVIAVGGGQGTTQLTMEQATAGDYPVESRANQDGSLSYFIEDTGSSGEYGRQWYILSLPNIRPITNSEANIVNAANALKLTAESFLSKHLVPKVVYTATVRGLRSELKVGDLVRITYRGQVEGYSYIDVDEDFYVMDVRRSRSLSGDRMAQITIATTSERRTSDEDTIIGMVHDLNSLKVHVQPTLAYSPVGPYIKRFKNGGPHALFHVRIGSEVLYLNYAILRFHTSPLKSSVEASAANGAHNHKMFTFDAFQAADAADCRYLARDISGGNNHVIVGTNAGSPDDLYTRDTSSDHTHDMTYGVFEDSTYPRNISIYINGVDRTTDLGGTWAPTSIEYEVELDITDILVNEPGGLRQTHEIEFRAANGKGEVECEVDMLVTIQAIAVA